MNKSIPLELEVGQTFFTVYGNTFALVFRGEQDFLSRSENLIHNFCHRRVKTKILDDITIYALMNEAEAIECFRFYYYCTISNYKSESDREQIATEKSAEFWEKKVQKKFVKLQDELGFYHPHAVSKIKPVIYISL